MPKGHEEVLAGANSAFLSHLTHYAEMRCRLAETGRVAVQWKAKAKEAEKKDARASVTASQEVKQWERYMGLQAETEQKLKEKTAELEREKNNFASVANKLSSERSHLEVLTPKITAEVELIRKSYSEESGLRYKAKGRLKEEEAKNKSLEETVQKLQADLEAGQAEVEAAWQEKVKIVSGIPGLLQKLIRSHEFRKPLATPYDACIRLGRHQTCRKILTEDPEFDQDKFGDHYNEDAFEILKLDTEKMFLEGYPFLSTIASQATDPADAILALEPA